MSQYPPPPGGPPMYPPNFPPSGPTGFGPPGYSLPSQSRTSAVAIVSLVSGLLICIPGVTGLVAIITGIIGIAQTSNPAYRGRGLAIAGLILGLLSLAGWGALGLGGYRVFQKSAPERLFAQQYVTDLTAGKVDQCVQNSTPNIAPAQLQLDYTQSQAWGTCRSAIAIPQNFNYNNGLTTIGFQGVGSFTSGAHKFLITVQSDSSGRKVDSFQWTQ
jgi:Domain of unknown function (DUF4190)